MLKRRDFLFLSAAALAQGAASRPLRGIFPIMQTPFTADDKVDNAILAKEAVFLDRCGVHGMVWPQLASEYFKLTMAERLSGAEALLAGARDLRAAVVIGVQAPEAAQAVEYARHATRLGAKALIALPPQGLPSSEADEGKVLSYYRKIGESSNLPLFVQAVGKMSVDFLIEMSKAVPTLRYVKDESGPVLNRITEFSRRAPELHSFSGNHGRTLYEEMLRGSAGSMPAAGFGDLYAAAWNAFQSGDRKRAAEMCGRCLLLITEMETYGVEAAKYVLHLRGVFPNYSVREETSKNLFDESARQSIRELVGFMKPYFQA